MIAEGTKIETFLSQKFLLNKALAYKKKTIYMLIKGKKREDDNYLAQISSRSLKNQTDTIGAANFSEEKFAVAHTLCRWNVVSST